ncbi:hypothetical protein [Moorena sp. SIO3I6]|uniref:hypothetical protein n=1 Tax=Moorena sp. SIO3I6 TaxID=2607831 RepID=UPI0025F91E66|nr:hypothetical protein [Moorena sp. SIO3I6]
MGETPKTPLHRFLPTLQAPDSRFPIPDSRFPTPNTPHPTPYSLLPTPYSLKILYHPF